MPDHRKSVGRPRQEPKLGERVQLSFRITPQLKRRLDAAAEESGRSQSQEAEIRLAHSFERDDLLDDVFAKAVEVAVTLLEANSRGEHPSWLRGTVRTRDEILASGQNVDEVLAGDQFVFILEADADEAVTREPKGNIPYADDRQRANPGTMSEHRYVARKSRLRLFSSSRAASTAADAVISMIKSGRKAPSHEVLAEQIRRELVAQARRPTRKEARA